MWPCTHGPLDKYAEWVCNLGVGMGRTAVRPLQGSVQLTGAREAFLQRAPTNILAPTCYLRWITRAGIFCMWQFRTLILKASCFWSASRRTSIPESRMLPSWPLCTLLSRQARRLLSATWWVSLKHYFCNLWTKHVVGCVETLLSQLFCQLLGKASGNLGSSRDTRENKCVCGQHVLRAQCADAEVRPWGKVGCGLQRQARASGDEIMSLSTCSVPGSPPALSRECSVFVLGLYCLTSWGRIDKQHISLRCTTYWTFLVTQMVKNLPAIQKTQVQSLGWEDPLEEEKATYSSILPWKIQWTEEPGGLHSMGSQEVGHDWATKLNILCFIVYFVQHIDLIVVYFAK